MTGTGAKQEGKLPYLVVREDDEGATTRRLHNDRQKLGVHRTEGRVPGTLRHSDVVIALLPLERLPVHMAEFGAAYHAKRHLKPHTARSTTNTNIPPKEDNITYTLLV